MEAGKPVIRMYGTSSRFEDGIVDMASKGYRLHSWHTATEGMTKVESVGQIRVSENLNSTVFYALFVPAEVSPPPPTREPLACR